MPGSNVPVTIPPEHTPGKTRPVWPGDREFPQAVLPGGREAGQIEITTRAKTYEVTQWRLTTRKRPRFSLASTIEYVGEWLDQNNLSKLKGVFEGKCHW